MKRGLWVVALLLVVGSQPAWAARLRVHEMAESQQYGPKFGGMLGRGLLNVVTSPVDLLVNTVNETKAGPPFVGTLTGLGRGLGCGLWHRRDSRRQRHDASRARHGERRVDAPNHEGLLAHRNSHTAPLSSGTVREKQRIS